MPAAMAVVPAAMAVVPATMAVVPATMAVVGFASIASIRRELWGGCPIIGASEVDVIGLSNLDTDLTIIG